MRELVRVWLTLSKVRALSGGLVFASFAWVAIWSIPGCHSFDDLSSTADSEPTAARCGECHQAVYAEWSNSPHARAFISDQFQARTDKGSVDGCNSCHVPDVLPVDLNRPREARMTHRDEGVHCLACHRLPWNHEASPSNARMAGPLGNDSLVDPHPVEKQAEWFRDAAFCGRCHEDTYAEWKASTDSAPASCQECHMPAVVRKVTQPSGLLSSVLVAFEGKHPTRAHDFSAGAATKETLRVLQEDFVSLDLSLERDQLRVRIQNRLPHGMPTGGFGLHSVVVRVLLDERNAFESVLSPRHRTAIGPGAEFETQVPWREGTHVVRVELERLVGGKHGKSRRSIVWSHDLEGDRLLGGKVYRSVAERE